jgi:HEAT repeat protein
MARDPEGDERLRRVMAGRREGDSGYLIEVLDREPENASLAATWLAKAGETKALPALVRLLDSDRDVLRVSAVNALIKLAPPPDAKGRLIEIARHDTFPNARGWACVALGKYRDRELVPLLISLLDDEHFAVRAGAAMGLGDIGDQRARKPVHEALKRLRRHPLHWYLSHRAYRNALRALKSKG